MACKQNALKNGFRFDGGKKVRLGSGARRGFWARDGIYISNYLIGGKYCKDLFNRMLPLSI